MNTTNTEISKLKSMNLNLMVEDVDKTVDFYVGLGFKVIMKTPMSDGSNSNWAFVQKDGIRLFFQSKPSLTAEFNELESYDRGGALTLWFEVEHIENWYNTIKNKATIIKPMGITDYNGATEFVIRDINGFILHFSNFELLKEVDNRLKANSEI